MRKVIGILFALIIVLSAYFIIKYRNQRQTLGSIVLFNGTSSSGKSSIIRELQKTYKDFVVVMIDEFLPSYEIEHPIPKEMTQEEHVAYTLGFGKADRKSVV